MFRIGGIVSGLDTDTIVKQLMQVERQPLDKLFQKKQTLEWQRDKYREMNLKLKSLEEAAFGLRLTSAFNTRVASTESKAFKVTANSTAQTGTYEFKVVQVATRTTYVSEKAITEKIADFSATKKLSEISGIGNYLGQTFTIRTYNSNNEEIKKEFTIEGDKSLNDILKEITEDPDLGVRAYYDSAYNRVVIERKETGEFNGGETGRQIEFSGDTNFLEDILQIDLSKEENSGKNAIVKYKNPVFGGAEIEQVSKTNTIAINGLTFDITETTADFEKVTVTSNVDQAVENIKKFVEKYNEIIAEIHKVINEPRYRDFPPLTDEQRREISEREAELWDEKAQSGLLRRDTILSSFLSEIRMHWYTPVKTNGKYTQITQIGIKTTSNYRDGGRLEIDEQALRRALEDDPDSVYLLFNNIADQALTSKDASSLTEAERKEINQQTGLIGRIRQTITNTMNKIVERAGNEFRTNHQFTIGKELDDIEKRMDALRNKLNDIENRYWQQFTRMEKLMSQANAQSTQLMAFLGLGAGK